MSARFGCWENWTGSESSERHTWSGVVKQAGLIEDGMCSCRDENLMSPSCSSCSLCPEICSHKCLDPCGTACCSVLAAFFLFNKINFKQGSESESAKWFYLFIFTK